MNKILTSSRPKTMPIGTEETSIEVYLDFGDAAIYSEIAFAYTPAIPPRTNCLPEDSEPGQDAEIELMGLRLCPEYDEKPEHECVWYDAKFLLQSEDFSEYLEKIVWEHEGE